MRDVPVREVPYEKRRFVKVAEKHRRFLVPEDAEVTDLVDTGNGYEAAAAGGNDRDFSRCETTSSTAIILHRQATAGLETFAAIDTMPDPDLAASMANMEPYDVDNDPNRASGTCSSVMFKRVAGDHYMAEADDADMAVSSPDATMG